MGAAFIQDLSICTSCRNHSPRICPKCRDLVVPHAEGYIERTCESSFVDLRAVQRKTGNAIIPKTNKSSLRAARTDRHVYWKPAVRKGRLMLNPRPKDNNGSRRKIDERLYPMRFYPFENF